MHTAFQARSVLETSLHGAANDQSISVGITPIGAQLRTQKPKVVHGHRALQDLVATPGAAARPGARSGEAHPVRMVLHQWRFP